MLRRARYCGVGIVVALLCAGCATAIRPVPRAKATDPEAVLSVVRTREDEIITIRTSFSAHTRERDRERAADGVVLVQKPDRFRLRLMLPLGITVFDYLTVGERTQLAFPLEGKIVNGNPQGEWAAFSRDDLGQAFLRGARAFPGSCRAMDQDETVIVVMCRDAANQHRRLTIERETAVIREEITYANEVPRLIVRYGDYRMAGKFPMPFRIELRYPERELVMEITVRSTEVNAGLDASLFTPLAPWDDKGSGG